MSNKAAPKMSSKECNCLCGAVSVTVSGVDKGAVLCHCTNCQKSSGSAFMHNYRFMKSDIKVHKGEDKIREFKDTNTKSRATLLRHFCSVCGSPLYVKPLAFEDLTIVHCSSAGDRTQPQFELFEENKHSWIGKLSSKRASL
ncbi:Hypothetical protein R9X50_00594300 [Acrodontium crateriforme]|uniref:CENP-V/GFA domain-containing protein n=1 Tax=Acrodontium crateriforme TaxID=150365 RepID=A0AAQ3M809_9PEZI|nr:Hypothetical protein R9X50_00594300 [Acrodontium crateriforme]